MGYDASIVIKEELSPKYKPLMKTITKDDVIKWNNLLIGVCMKDRGEFNNDDMSNIYDEIFISLKTYISYISDLWKINLENHLKKTNTYSVNGWSYKDKESYDMWTINDFIEFEMSCLFRIGIVKTPDILTEPDRYYSKLDIVKGYVEDIEENINDIWNHEFFFEYKDKENSEFEEDE